MRTSRVSIRADRSATVVRDPVVEYFTDLQGRASTWVQDVGALRLGVMLAAVAVAIAALVAGRRLGHRGAIRDTTRAPVDRE